VLLATDGFEVKDIEERWVSGSGSWVGTGNLSGAGRFGGDVSVFQSVASTVYYHRMFAESGTIIVGFAYKANGLNSSGFDIPICAFWGDARTTEHIYIGLQSTTHKIVIRRGNWGGTTLATSASAAVPNNAWCYIEVKVVLHDTTGSVEVRMDGAAAVSVSGADTRNGGTLATMSSVMIGSQANFAASPTLFWDDFYICDTTDGTATQGAPLDDFLGDVRVRTLLPSGAGASTQLTPSTGSNYDNVNDAPPVTTTYNFSSTSGHRDTYGLPNPSIPGTDTVVAVAAYMLAQRDNTSAISMKQAVKSGATVAYGSTRALTTTRTPYLDVLAEDPNTSAAWTSSAVDAMEIGAEVV
jgi:hypothetical protein